MASLPARPQNREGFRIAIFCALTLEADMVESTLDKIWTDDGPSFSKAVGDPNVYTTGVLSGHNVVLCHMADMGGNNAAACAASLRISFPEVEIAFVVGICGVAPKNSETREDIMLGDCIISTAVTQYDFGRQYPDGFSVKTNIDNSLGRASVGIRATISKLRTRRNTRRLTGKLSAYLRDLNQKEPDTRCPGIDKDRLFDSEYDHYPHLPDVRCTYCGKNMPGACPRDCTEVNCELAFAVSRTRQIPGGSADGSHSVCEPKIHFGRFGSANTVVKAGIFRDRIAKQHDVIAFEMEGAGTWDVLPTIVIKAACDYADSHKNKGWQLYAAAVSASCLRATLADWESFEPEQAKYEGGLLGKRKAAELLAPEDAETQKIKQRDSVLTSLNFNAANDRVDNIRSGHSATCHWLLEHKLYLSWRDDAQDQENHTVLWIKGKAGSGKSTLMKYMLTEAVNLGQRRQDFASTSRQVTISFFFNARGRELERTTAGMYRSLLVQLFNSIPEMLEILDVIDSEKFKNNISLVVLENLLYAAIKWISQSHWHGKHSIHVLCFVDALDECPEDQVRAMLRLFERLSDATTSQDKPIPFRICFSSRHYPNISMKLAQELILDEQKGHIDDISKYIDAELRLESSNEAESIKAEIVEKSGHIFLWVVLVVRMLIKEYDKGRIRALRKKLTEIPKELNDLFKDIILRDQDNIEELVLCIQLVLYVKRPLTIDEFYSAMQWGIDRTNPDLTDEYGAYKVDPKDMQKYALNSSKGLVEVTQYVQGIHTSAFHRVLGSTAPTMPVDQRVQFIHESVREFFMKEQALVSSWIGIHSIVAGQSHDRIKDICYQQMTSIGPISYIHKFSFLRYSVENVLWHANLACSYGISQLDFLDQFHLQGWKESQSMIALDSSCCGSGTTLLHVLAYFGLSFLINQELIRNPASNNQPKNQQEELPIYIALRRNNVAAAMELLRPAPTPQTNLLEYREAISSACYAAGGRHPRQGQSIFQYFAERRLDKLVNFLLSSTEWIDRQNATDVLIVAIRYQNTNIVKRILDRKDVQVNARDYEGCTPLYIAAREGYTQLVRCLIAKNASIDKGQLSVGSHITPLLAAITHEHEDISHILLDNGANPWIGNNFGHTPLHLAAYKDSVPTVEHLLRLDPSPSLEARSKTGWLPLHIAAFHGSVFVLRLIIDQMKTIDSPTTNGGYTALWLASRTGCSPAVQCLLDRKAKIEATARGNWTALHAAIASGSQNTVQILLEAGANTLAQTTSVIPQWPSSGMLGNDTSNRVLDHRLEIRMQRMQRVTPFHLAMLYLDLSMIDFLIGFDTLPVTLVDDMDVTALEIAMAPLHTRLSTEDMKILRTLREKARHRTDRAWIVLNFWLGYLTETINDRDLVRVEYD